MDGDPTVLSRVVAPHARHQSTPESRARRRRTDWSRRFRPQIIDLLIVAEAPPTALDRYFYFARVPTQDALFRSIVQSVLGLDPTRADKKDSLARLRERGAYLVDLSLEPVPRCGRTERRRRLRPHVRSLVRRVARLSPRRIVLVDVDVYDLAYDALLDAGLPVVNERIPFPGSGRQRRFRETFARARRRPPFGGWAPWSDRDASTVSANQQAGNQGRNT